MQVDFSTVEAFEKAKSNEETDSAPVSSIPGTVEDWLREQDMKRERGELVSICAYILKVNIIRYIILSMQVNFQIV